RRLPDDVTTAWWKEERGERVFIDYNQNARDRTIASAYSVRARPDATVSAPVTWDELQECETEDFTMATMPDRFARLRDVQAAAALAPARRRAGGHRRRRLRSARAPRVGRAGRADGARRGAVSAELPEDARRASAGPAVAQEDGGLAAREQALDRGVVRPARRAHLAPRALRRLLVGPEPEQPRPVAGPVPLPLVVAHPDAELRPGGRPRALARPPAVRLAEGPLGRVGQERLDAHGALRLDLRGDCRRADIVELPLLVVEPEEERGDLPRLLLPAHARDDTVGGLVLFDLD